MLDRTREMTFRHKKRVITVRSQYNTDEQ